MNPGHIKELIRKYATGEATDSETAELFHWYRSQPIEQVDWPADSPSEAITVRHRMVERLINEVTHRKVKVVRFAWARVAAMLLVFIGIGSLLYYLSFSLNYISISNPSGTVRLVHLPDSSRVWLNASSTLEYAEHFTSRRELRLTGEAYFQVVPDKSHPFIVQAGSVRTTVVGTSFNINAYSKDQVTTVSVTGGKVAVSSNAGMPTLLTPSTQFQLDKNTGHVTTSSIDTSSAIAWKEGKLQFHGVRMGDIAKRLENWYGYKINFTDPAMANCRYYMTFRNSLSPDQLFSAMSEVADLKYTINHNLKTVTLTGSTCR